MRLRHAIAIAILPVLIMPLSISPAAAASAVQITYVQYDSPGPDTRSNKSLNAEWVRIRNFSSTKKTLTGWTLRDRAGHVYRFNTFALKPGKSVRIHTGKGANTAADRYWRRDRYVWNNRGDKAILRNRAGTTMGTCTWGDGDGTKTCVAVAATPPPVGNECSNPYFTTSHLNGGITDGGYYVHNNLWNAADYPGTKGTTQVCSYRSWNHVGTANDARGDGAVKTYANVHKDYSGRTISSFPRLTSTFAARAPGTGTYNVAYDLWLNGVPNDEVMIWTDNHQQVPAGSRFSAGVSLSGYTWDVYATRDNGYVAFVPSNGARLTSGTLDLKAMLNYLVDRGRVAPNATVDQICYGVELVDTGGLPATWRFTEFSITDS